MQERKIRISLPSKGRLGEKSRKLLANVGFRVYSPNPRQYKATIPRFPQLEVIFQRPTDIVHSVREGSVDFGITGRDIFLDHTLLIFDEVQHCPQALTSLKYFHEAYPEAYICASGSLLGLGLSQADFPVGKVRREWLRPMSFCEFLEALDETRLIQTLRSAARERAASPPLSTTRPSHSSKST